MHRAGRPPSRIRQASASADADTATLHTEHSAEQADRTGVDLPIISLSQIRRLDVGRITLSDVVSYAQPGGAVAERVRDAGSTEDHIHVAHDDTPPSREEGLFRRRRGPEAAARRQTARQRRALSAPVAERQVVSAYLSTVPGRRDSTTHEPSVVPGLATASSAGVLQAGSRQERVDAHNAWLLRKEGERGNTWKILELLQAGVPARSADEGGRTACHFAGMNNHSKAIIALANPHQNAYIPHNFEDAAGDGATALHYAAFNGCIEAAKTILKMHRGQIQAERFKRRDADAARLGENQVELRRNEQQLTALRARMEELEEKEFELTSRIETLNDQMTQEDERFKLENDDLRYKQKQAEETLEVHAQQTEKLEQTVAHWKPISRIKYEAFNTEWEAAKIELSKLEMALIDAVSGVEDATKAHGKTKRKLSRQLLQAQQSLEATKEKLHDKTEAETKMSALNTQLKEENQTLRLSVAEFSRKVVHVCKGPHHIEFNAEIHKRAADGSTPLHWAVDSGQDDMCHLLLECGADANAKDAQGLTPLHWGAIASAHDSSIPEPKVGLCYLQACQELLAKGGKCNAVDSLGCAPLHYAAQSGFAQLIQVLKEWGGDASLQNNAGANPLHYAMAQQSPDLEVALALVAGIKDIYSAIHIQDKNGMSPMHYANALGHPQMASQLAVHCNALQLAQSEESIRQARMGLRDATHMQLSQLVGAHVITGSTSEHERYYTNDLAPTRNKGWSRNDLIHQLRPQPAASSNQKLRSADLFQSLSLSLTRIATQDDSDFLALSFEPTNSIGDEGERHTNASAVAPRTTTR